MEQGFKFTSLSLTLADDNFENPRSSAPKKTIPLTLFDDLLDNPETANQLPSTNNNPSNQRQKGAMSLSARGVSAAANEQGYWASNCFSNIPAGDENYELIKKQLKSSVSLCGLNVEMKSINRIGYFSRTGQAKLESFDVYLEGVKMMCGGNANVKYGWYGASKGEINGILASGFDLSRNIGVYGHGVYLSAVDHPVESLQSSTSDEDGLRHMLMCRVILGRVEVVNPFSGQYNPNTDLFHSVVDNLVYPKRYIIWSANMNTHILPEFLISFRTSSHFTGVLKILQPYPIWMPMAALINSLSFSLPAQSVISVAKYYDDYKKHKLSTEEFAERLREIVGDRLLIAMLKSYTENHGHIEESAGQQTS